MIEDDSPLAGSSDATGSRQRVRLIDGKGRNFGVMMLSEARRIADEQRVELVGIALTVKPPIYRLVKPGERQEPKRSEYQKHKDKRRHL